MAKKVSNKDLIVGDPLAEFRKSAKLTIEEFKKLELGLKGFAKAAKSDLKGIKLDSFTNISKATQSIQTIDKSFKGLNQTTKERIKLQDKLKRANSDSIQKNAELQVQLQAQTKTNKQLAREALGLVGAYEKQAKKLVILRKSFKDIVLVEGESSKAAIRLQREITKLDGKLRKVDAAAGQFQRNVGNYPKTFGRAIATLGSFAASLGLIGGAAGILGLVKSNATLSDSMSDVRKTTGLTDVEVNKLNGSLERLNTRTSQIDLLGIATAGGRLGIAKDELLEFTEAIDKVFVSLGDELSGTAEEIATDIAKISDIFDITEQFGVAEGINKLGSAINFLGANTKAQSGFLLDFTKRLTGARELTNISATDVLGYAATLDELGQSVEVSGTAVSQIFIKLTKNSAAFAKAAGQDIKEFEDLVNTDINKAFTVFAKGITNNNKTATELSGSLNGLGIDGVRASNVVLALAKNTDKLRINQEIANKAFEEGTSITEEFNIKNNNLAANLEKLVKIIKNKVINSGFTKFLTEATRAIIDNISAIGKAIKVLAALVVGVTAYKIVQALANKESKIAIFLTKAYTKAQKLFTRQEKFATIATQAFNKATKANVIGVLIGLVLAAVTAFSLFKEEAEDAADAQREFNEAVEEGLELRRGIKAIEDRVNTVDRLNKTQLNNLLSDIETEIDENEAKEAKLIDLAENRAGELVRIQELNTKKRLSIEQELLQAQTDEEKFEIQLRLDAFEVFARNLEKEQEGITKVEVEENKIRLEEFKKTVLARLGSIKSTRDEGKALNDLIEIQRTLLKLAQGFAGTTEAEIASRNQKIAVINEEIKRLQALGREKQAQRRTDAEIQKDTQARFDLEFDRQKQRDKENEDNLAKAVQRRDEAGKTLLAKSRGAAAEEQRIHEQRVEAAIRASNIISEAFGNALNDVFDEQEKALNASIKRREEGVERQQRRAENGLDNQLAFEKKKLAEAEVERQALAEKRARQEEALALAQTYLNFVQARAATDPDTANIKALQDTLAAKAIKDGIVALAGSAYDGEEDTGKVYGGGLDGKGGRLWMLHDNEGVVTKKGNQDNAGLVGAMNSGDVTGWFANNMVAPELKTNNYDTFALLAQKMDSLEETIKKRPIPSFAFDKYGNIIQSVYRNGVKDTTTHVNKESII